MSTVIKVENISKQYRLGQVGTGSLAHDVNRFWHRVRGKEDPYLKIGEENDRSVKGSSEYVWALKDINFEVKQGEVLGIIGRNGAGKSTLLKILSRTTTPTTGKVKIKGRVASLLEVGTGFHPELSGRENIFLNGAILGMTKQEIKSKFDEIVDFAGVERYIDTPVKRYSSGMYVRLAFGVAAHLEPEILIVDEVLAVGDAEFQKKALGKMKDVSNEEGRTVLFVSHNLTSISTLCNKLAILKNGTILYNDDANEGLKIYLGSTVKIVNNSLENFLRNQEDELFELLDFEIVQKAEENKQFQSDVKIEINFRYRIKKRCVGLRIGFDLVDQQNDLIIFRSFHDDSVEQAEVFLPGRYTSSSQIPPDLLKAGTYIIRPAIGVHNLRWIVFGSVEVQFNILNISGINKIYADNRPGVIMPKIEWLTAKTP